MYGLLPLVEYAERVGKLAGICAICGQPEGKHSFVGDNCPPAPELQGCGQPLYADTTFIPTRLKGRAEFAYKSFGDRVESDIERDRR